MKTNSLPSIFPWMIVIVSALVIWGVINSWPISILGGIIIISLFAYFFHVNSLQSYTQDAADSIYYFGFSITVITLATSAIFHFGNKQNIENLGLVFSQFGVGLIATCIGLLLRLWIIAKLNVHNHIDTPKEEEQARQQLITDFSMLRLEVLGFAEQLKELNQSLNRQQKELQQKTVLELNQLSQNGIEASQQASLNAIKIISQQTASLQQLQQTFFTESLATLKQTIAEANQNFKELSLKTYQEIASLNFLEVSKKTNKAISELSMSIGDFSNQAVNATKYLNNISTDLGNFSSTVKSYQTQMTSVNYSLQSITENITKNYISSESHLKSSEELLGKMNAQHREYVDIYNKYQQASENAIQKTTKAVDSVANALTEVANQAVRKLN